MIGQFYFPSGKVVACDALRIHDPQAYEQEITPGNYSVELNIADIERPKDRRVSPAVLRITPGAPVDWKVATLPGKILTKLGEGYLYSYGFDSGTGSFMDIGAAKLLERECAKKDTLARSSLS